MPTLTLRQVDQQTYDDLKAAAARAGRSMEAEARAVLDDAMRGRTWWSRWLEEATPFRGDDLPIPPRSTPRTVDLT